MFGQPLRFDSQGLVGECNKTWPPNSGNNVGMEGLASVAGDGAKLGRGRGSGIAPLFAWAVGTLAHSRGKACGLMLSWLGIVATPSPAHPLSLQECLEGGDFITHAAQARDNGMTKATFNDKLLGDIYLIQAFPRELRWFVQDPEDAEFLLAEATTVFDRPRAPEAHRTDFLSRCFNRKLGTDGSTSPIAGDDAPAGEPDESGAVPEP